MQRNQTPTRLWCFCYEYSADILSLCASNRFELRGRTLYEMVTNYTPDISEYTAFSWFQWIWFLDEDQRCRSLCRWIEPAHHIGQSMCWFIIRENGEYLARSSVITIEESSMESLELKNQMMKFTKSLEAKIGNSSVPLFEASKPENIYYSPFGATIEDDSVDLTCGDNFMDLDAREIDTRYLNELDILIGAQVTLPDKDGLPLLAVVKK